MLLATSLATSLLPFCASPSQAQEASAIQATAAFNIPAQPLDTAINAFISQSGWQISYSSALVSGKKSTPVSGTMQPLEALRRLIAGTGLAVRVAAPGSAALVDPSATAVEKVSDGATLLSPITLESDGTVGLVASRSSAATRTDTPVTEIPQTISTVTEEEFKERGVNDFNDVIAYTPGVRSVDYPGGQGLGARFYMRGFRYSGNAPFFRDGLRNSYNPYDANIEPFGLEQVDVLRGPSSVLYGDSTPGGLINMQTKRPTQEPLREIGVEYGSYDRRQITGDFSGPIDDAGIFSYRLTGLYRESGTQIDHSPDDAIYIAPALTIRPDAVTSLTLMAQYQKWKLGGSEQSLPYDSAVAGTAASIPTDLFLGVPGLSEWNGESISAGYAFEHEFDNGWKLNNNVRYTRTWLDYVSAWTWPITLTSDRYLYIGLQDRPRTSENLTTDINLGRTFEFGSTSHELLFGVNYGYSNLHETRTNTSNTLELDITNPNYSFTPNWCYLGTYCRPWSDSTDDVKQAGVYVQDQASWNNWNLTLSGRYDWAEISSHSYDSRTLSGLTGASNSLTREYFRAFTGRAGLGYDFDNGVTPYVSYSTSFEPAAGSDVNGNTFDPTTGEQFEAGIKFMPNGWNTLFTASAFQLTQQNVTTSDPLNTGFSVQTGEIRSRGVELEAKGDLGNGWNFLASYAYTDAEVTEDNANSSGISKKGTRVETVPYHTASLWLGYDFQLASLEGLSVGVGLRHVGSSLTYVDTSTGGQLKVPGYTLLDASASYDFGQKFPQMEGVKLSLSGTNLTDEIYYAPGFYADSVLAGKRRTLKANLTYRF